MKYRKYVRIDERMIHGQVLIKWLGQRKTDTVVIIDETIQENPILKSVMQKSLPKEYDMKVFGKQEGAVFLKETEFQDTPLILVREIMTLKKLEEEGVLFKEINIARMPYQVGKEKICDKIYMNDFEKEIVRHFLDKGCKIFVQMVPDSEIIWLEDYL